MSGGDDPRTHLGRIATQASASGAGATTSINEAASLSQEMKSAADSQNLPIPESGDPSVVLAAAARAIQRGVSGAMATVLERHGSTPGTPGQKLYLSRDGAICIGTVGGGAVEREVLAILVEMTKASEPKHEVRTFKLGPELGMCCGGRVVVLVEPIGGLTPALIIGGGHVGSAVAPLLAKVGFAVTVIDERDPWGRDGRIPNVRCVVGEFDDEAGREIDAAHAVCLVMTHDHGLDQRAIEWALKRGFAFVGGVGSRAKAERTRQRLEAKGFSEADRGRVQMPLGANIHARTPDEIAVAIAAEMISWRKARTNA